MPPAARNPSTFAGGAVSGSSENAGTPRRRAAQASASAVFPALTVERPGATRSSPSCETASQMPRTLKEPVGSRVSAFSSSPSASSGPAGRSGLGGNTCRSRAAAARASLQPGGAIVFMPPAAGSPIPFPDGSDSQGPVMSAVIMRSGRSSPRAPLPEETP